MCICTECGLQVGGNVIAVTEANTRETLLQLIDAAELPHFLGGQRMPGSSMVPLAEPVVRVPGSHRAWLDST